MLGYSHTTYASPCSELIPEFRVHKGQGGVFLAGGSAGLVPVNLPTLSHDQFVVAAKHH